MKYLRESAVKQLINELDKRAGKDFLFVLDAFVEQKIKQACSVHNGSKKTLDSSVAGYVGIKLK